jgi:NAD(P)H dehydrogenase (quinone)
MILITGATGQLGKSVVEFLLKKLPATKIAALARDQNKAADLKAKGIDVRIGDYDNKASLVAAFKGIDKLFFVSGNDVLNRQKQHENVIEAAKEASIKHIVYTSFARKNETGSNPLGIVASSHIKTDRLIKASGIPYTIMLNGLYTDVLPLFFGEKVLEAGIYLPAGNGKAAYIKRDDIAEVAANILTGEGHERKEYNITNTENYSLQNAASILSELSGKQITYYSPSKEEYIKTVSSAGVPQEIVGLVASFSEAIKQDEFNAPDSDIEKLLGRTPSTLKEYFQETYFSKN